MRNANKAAMLTLIIPLAVSLLVLCITAGYWIYARAKMRDYADRWKDYDECGFA